MSSHLVQSLSETLLQNPAHHYAIQEMSSESQSENYQESSESDGFERILMEENKRKRESLLNIIRASENNAKIKPEDYENYISNAGRKEKIDLLKKQRDEVENIIYLRIANIEKYEIQLKKMLENIEKNFNLSKKNDELKQRREEFEKKQKEGTENVRVKYDDLKNKLKKVERSDNNKEKTSIAGDESPSKKDLGLFLTNLEQSLESKILNLKETNTFHDPKHNIYCQRESGRVVTKSGIKVNKRLMSRITMLEGLLSGKRNSSNLSENETKFEHLTMDRAKPPKMRNQKSLIEKQLSKEW